MKSALLVIDVQEAFLNRETRDVPKKIGKFIESQNFDFVLFFKFLNEKDSNWTRVLKWERMLRLDEAEIAPELRRFAKKDNVFIKRTAFSVFDIKNFHSFLKKKRISSLFICGLDTHACVLVSTMDAFAKGFDVKVIEDLCAASHGKKYHEMAIEILKSNLTKSTVIESKGL